MGVSQIGFVLTGKEIPKFNILKILILEKMKFKKSVKNLTALLKKF